MAAALVNKLLKLYSVDTPVNHADVSQFNSEHEATMVQKPLSPALARRLLQLVSKDARSCANPEALGELLRSISIFSKNDASLQALLDEQLAKRFNEVRGCLDTLFEICFACPFSSAASQAYNSISLNKEASDATVVGLCLTLLRWMRGMVSCARVFCLDVTSHNVTTFQHEAL
jgi:hypothetical protein